MTAVVPDWWGTVEFALRTVSRHRSPNGPTAELLFSQKPLFVRLHSRSTEYNSMLQSDTFESTIQSFSYTPLKF
eukprot:COSAG02_NODE_27586_length_606_cov_1.205128_1_plen_74_part_00